MKDWYKLLLLVVIIQILSCSNENKTHSFRKTISDFEPEFVNHIPEKMKDVKSFQVYRNLIPENDWLTSNDVGRLFIQLEFESDSKEVQKLREYYASNSIYEHSSSDKNIIIPLYFKDSLYTKEHKKKELYAKYIKELNDSVTEKKYPVPNFKYTFDFDKKGRNEIGLTDDYLTYVIDSKNKDSFKNNKYHMNGSQMYFPEEWLHGISKGVSINKLKNEIIYWVIYW